MQHLHCIWKNCTLGCSLEWTTKEYRLAYNYQTLMNSHCAHTMYISTTASYVFSWTSNELKIHFKKSYQAHIYISHPLSHGHYICTLPQHKWLDILIFITSIWNRQSMTHCPQPRPQTGHWIYKCYPLSRTYHGASHVDAKRLSWKAISLKFQFVESVLFFDKSLCIYHI